VRILLIDDHQLVREALAYYLKSSGEGIDVLEAGGLAEVADQPPADTVDLVLLDYRLPGLSGERAVAAACERFPETPVIVLSGAVTRDEAQAALRSGAAGVISKDIEGGRLMQTIHAIVDGDAQIFGLFDPVPAPAAERRTTAPAALADLSVRERQVAELLVAGRSNKEIADALNIADITVRLHLRRLFRKLDARSRTDAVRIILTRPETLTAERPAG
jgi:DNA-binding NarL/FixJ family response regulator